MAVTHAIGFKAHRPITAFFLMLGVDMTTTSTPNPKTADWIDLVPVEARDK
jgi:hypothetical protein